MTPTCNYLLLTDGEGPQPECGLPARWQHGEIRYCESHACRVSERIPLTEIDGRAVLDRRPAERHVRRYRYPTPKTP